MDSKLNTAKRIYEQNIGEDEYGIKLRRNSVKKIYEKNKNQEYKNANINKRKIINIIESEENEMSKKFIYYIASSCPIIWVDAIEYERAINKLSQQCIKNLNSKCFKWDIVNGIFNINKQTVETKTDTTPLQPLLF